MTTNDVNSILPLDWCGLEETPPDEKVEVIDEKGNTAFAHPTWYPFKVVPNTNKIGKWTSDVVFCDPYWDGGWMVECVGMTNNIGSIIGWKVISSNG